MIGGLNLEAILFAGGPSSGAVTDSAPVVDFAAMVAASGVPNGELVVGAPAPTPQARGQEPLGEPISADLAVSDLNVAQDVPTAQPATDLPENPGAEPKPRLRMVPHRSFTPTISDAGTQDQSQPTIDARASHSRPSGNDEEPAVAKAPEDQSAQVPDLPVVGQVVAVQIPPVAVLPPDSDGLITATGVREARPAPITDKGKQPSSAVADRLPDIVVATPKPVELRDVAAKAIQPVAPELQTSRPDPAATIFDPRLPLVPHMSGPMSADTATSNPDHGSALVAQIMTIARDLVAVAGDKDVRFNVRPEALGPVAVTIARGDEGPTLRLGVDTTAAMQTVRQAEPQLTDLATRTGASFVHVAVDLNSREQRGRPQPTVSGRRARDVLVQQPLETVPVPTGRFA